MKKRQHGVTITELMMSIAILGVVMLVLPMAARILNSVRYQQQAVLANSQLQIFFNQLGQDVRSAPRFDLDYSAVVVKPEYAAYLSALDAIFTAASPPQAGEYVILRKIDNAKLDYSNPNLLQPNCWGVIVYFLQRTPYPVMVRRVLFKTPYHNNLASPDEMEYLRGQIAPPVSPEKIFNQVTFIREDIDEKTLVKTKVTVTKRDTIRVEVKIAQPFRNKTEVKRYSEEMTRWSSYWD